jgi:hypothetical protein
MIDLWPAAATSRGFRRRKKIHFRPEIATG